MSNEASSKELTRGQKAAATRAANAKRPVGRPKKAATAPKPEKQSFTFAHKGDTITVTVEGNAWTVATS